MVRKGRRWVIGAALFFLVLALAGLGGSYAWYRTSLAPPSGGGTSYPIVVEISPGMSSRDIADLLSRAGVIRSATAFTLYLRLEEPSAVLLAGRYRFETPLSVPEVVRMLREGRTYVETVTFTVPEGFTAEEIASLLEEKGLCTREAFLSEVSQGSFALPLLDDVPSPEERPGRKYRWEGYLFPDTYTVPKDAGAHEIAERMIRRFVEVFDPAWREELQRRGISLDEAVIVASLVEREAVVPEERPKIAGVIYNRLARKMPLQIDATVAYALGDPHRQQISYGDLEVDHPYNTYRVFGLPPGPIANPGRDALKAAVFPESHTYLYYVTKKDGSGEHYFAPTYEEHLANIRRSEENARRLSSGP